MWESLRIEIPGEIVLFAQGEVLFAGPTLHHGARRG